MKSVCFGAALALTALLTFVSHVQLLYLESLRLIRRETPALDFFRETLAAKIGLELETGSLAFSLIKHVSLYVLGILYFCALDRPSVAWWQGMLEAFLCSSLAMIVSTYLLPMFLYRRTRGTWIAPWTPIVRWLGLSAIPFVKLIRGFQSLLDLDQPTKGEPAAADSVESIEAFISAGAEEGILEEEDRRLIHSVVAFGDKSVREVMTPRPSIVAISGSKSLEDLRQLVIHEQYSRIPVYSNTIDNLIGFVHVRDMFELSEEDRQTKPVRDILRPLPLVPETKPVSELLREMQHEGSHMVGVVDEYGNIAGIATMEDLVEEILGEIRDEHEPDRDVHQVAEKTYVVSGSLDLDRLHELVEFRPEDDTESTTIGGLVTEWLGHVPQAGEAVERDGLRIEVLSGNERRVNQVKISRANAPVIANA